MPVVSMFYGIIVYMYFRDNKQHNIPHIHIKYNEYKAIYSIPDGKLLDGKIPSSKEKLVLAWIELRQDELMADWHLAVEGEPIYKIEPLK